ncbi:MAG: chromosomal replication initiator protein DnaA [Gemmatimonadetes bacterium]|nr:chromosomal replication initiator protein DnaA [Gemmatimonadota bacterium]
MSPPSLTAMELTAVELWARILERARPQLAETSFRTWLGPTAPLSLSAAELCIGVRTEFAAEWIEDRYGSLLADIARAIAGRPLPITFKPFPERSPPAVAGDDVASLAVGGTMLDPAAAALSVPPRPTARPCLNEMYTFERFVVGANSQLAAAAARAVATSPARLYNPLLIYGGIGLGKTHLAHAVGHLFLERFPGRRIAYLSSERFTNDLIGAIQSGRTAEFRHRYREVELLLIDDVQFLGGKERTQEEFFHTFNTLHEARRQIVLISDRAPSEINGLDRRLVSRFEWGLVADIQPPDLETRVAIVRAKAAEAGLRLTDEVIELAARACRSSVREIEGTVIKLLAYASLTGRELSREFAQQVFGDHPGLTATDGLSPSLICRQVAQAWGVDVAALRSSRRTKDVTVPRHVAMYLMREVLKLSLVEVGRHFGGRDHSTVVHALCRVQESAAADEQFRQRLDSLREALRSSQQPESGKRLPDSVRSN